MFVGMGGCAENLARCAELEAVLKAREVGFPFFAPLAHGAGDYPSKTKAGHERGRN